MAKQADRPGPKRACGSGYDFLTWSYTETKPPVYRMDLRLVAPSSLLAYATSVVCKSIGDETWKPGKLPVFRQVNRKAY